ncbi:TonB-dependent receptor plug domain-containing protein, partial [bacterium]|nr:TonB-dependent receptor plug domain-containing protein [bacterium]
MALLQTGVSVFHLAESDSTVGTGTKFSVAGSRPAHNNFMLDGISINDGASSTPGSASGSNLGVEGIREFKVLTSSYSAAFGRNSGATITIVTKSGTNQLHGSLFYFHRNSALDARNFFDIDPANPTERSKTPGFKRNQFGFSLGGPIVEDKTFIFGTYEGLRERLGLTNVGVVINEDARNGILPGGNVMVADSVKPFFPFIPIPNGRDFGDGTAEFLSSPSKRTDEDYFSVRLDHQFSESNSLFGRYTFDDAEVITPDQIVLYEDVFNSRNQSFVLEERSILSPSFINTARVGFSRSFFQLESACITSCPDTFISGRAFGKFRFGQAQSGPAPITTIGTENPAFSPYTTFQFGDDMNWTRGS